MTEVAGPSPDRGDVARLFIAVVPPSEVLAAIMGLPRLAVPGVRYMGPDQLHVTLRFLGNAPIGAAVAALQEVAAPPVEVTVGPQTVRLGRQVVCLPVHGLEVVARSVLAATGAIGRPPEPRPFRGHLTIARLAREARKVDALLNVPFEAQFGVEQISLVRSVLGRGGARYDTVAQRVLTTVA